MLKLLIYLLTGEGGAHTHTTKLTLSTRLPSRRRHLPAAEARRLTPHADASANIAAALFAKFPCHCHEQFARAAILPGRRGPRIFLLHAWRHRQYGRLH